MRASTVASFALGWLASGCTSLGPCDPGSQPGGATEIVYDLDGVPAYAGQALAIQTCGGGGHCHSEGIAPVDRLGAPMGLDFDLRLASTSPDTNLDAVDRLLRDQRNIARTLVWDQVSSGRMPPGGEGDRILMDGTHYDRKTGPTVYSSLPNIRSAEGRDIFRNWLSCGAPLVERTTEAVEIVPQPAGVIVPEADPPRRCADATWPSLYATVFAPRCALSSCHSGATPTAGLSLASNDPSNIDEIYAVAMRLIGGTSGDGSQLCRVEAPTVPYITANDTSQSLLYLKVQDDGTMRPCGSRMPLQGSYLPQQRIDALRVWIECGACTSPSCEASCQSMARAMGVVPADDSCLVSGVPMP